MREVGWREGGRTGDGVMGGEKTSKWVCWCTSNRSV